jgi:hypothetical protein
MTQRIFDVENAEDMALLWSILPDDMEQITHLTKIWVSEDAINYLAYRILPINWHDKTKITRPIQEATEADIGKICYFWNGKMSYIGELRHIENTDTGKYYEMFAPVAGNLQFVHCRRLTKQEVEKLI